MGMKGEERDAFIAQCCDAFKRALLARASKVPYNWDCPEIRQWVIDTAREMRARDARRAAAEISNRAADSWTVALCV
jgi:hypothetical protein